MSVWKSACYRDDALQWYLRNSFPLSDDSPFVHSLCDFEIGDFGEFPVPEGVQRGCFADCVKQDDRVLRRFQAREQDRPSHALTALAKKLGPVKFGIKATYHVAAKILKRAQHLGDRDDGNKKFYEHLVKYGFAASSHSARDYDARSDLEKYILTGHFPKVKDTIRELVRARGLHKSSSYAADIREANALQIEYPKCEERGFEFFKDWDVWSFPGAIIIQDPTDLVTYILLANDIERIDRICTGVEISRAYLAGYGDTKSRESKALRRSLERMIELFVDTFMEEKRPNEVCRAFDVAYHYVLAKHAGRDDHRALKEQKDKFHDEGLEHFFSLSTYYNIVSTLNVKEALEVCMIYKCLPQPDFDYISAAQRQKEMYEANLIQASEDHAAEGDMFDDILRYHKWVMLHAFWSAHGKCPGHVRDGVLQKEWHLRYPHVKPSDIDYTESMDVDFNGTFAWRGRERDIIDLVNDKAICPANIKDGELNNDYVKRPIADRNQLVDVLMRKTAINLREVDRSNMPYDVKADDKPESKKPNGRWFFEANTLPRLKQSEYEDSVSYYAKHVVGCFSGKSNADKIRQMNAITEVVADGLPFQALNISFDIKKFSPYLPIQVHKCLDEQWAEAFGVPDLLSASKIFSSGKIHYIKGCIHHVFDKLGTDFEGFAGKKLTIYHCAVMGYTARQLRIQKVTERPCRFAALIDDGLLRLVLKRANFSSLRNKALEIIESVYSVAALRISWDKTYVSSLLSVFLHEIRMTGRSMTPGLRAILKLSNRSDAAQPSMLDDLQYLRSTASGAIIAGALPVATYMLYLHHVLDLIKKWAPKHEKVRHTSAIKCFSPLQVGGLAVESMTSLSGSVSQSQFADCLGRLKLIGYRYKDVRPAIQRILGIELQAKQGDARYTDPASVKAKFRTLRNDRVQTAVERHLLKTISAPVVQALIPVLEADEVGYLEAVVDSGSNIPVPLREALHDMSPRGVVKRVAAKFLRARTAQILVPYRIFKNIGYAYMNEASEILSSYVI